jgi:hypothetical protein
MRCCDTLCACEGQTCKSIVDTDKTKCESTHEEREKERQRDREMDGEREKNVRIQYIMQEEIQYRKGESTWAVVSYHCSVNIIFNLSGINTNKNSMHFVSTYRFVL